MTPLSLPLHYFQCLMTREKVTKVEAVTPSASASWGAWFPRPPGVLPFQPQKACVSYENHVSRVCPRYISPCNIAFETSQRRALRAV